MCRVILCANIEFLGLTLTFPGTGAGGIGFSPTLAALATMVLLLNFFCVQVKNIFLGFGALQ